MHDSRLTRYDSSNNFNTLQWKPLYNMIWIKHLLHKKIRELYNCIQIKSKLKILNTSAEGRTLIHRESEMSCPFLFSGKRNQNVNDYHRRSSENTVRPLDFVFRKGFLDYLWYVYFASHASPFIVFLTQVPSVGSMFDPRVLPASGFSGASVLVAFTFDHWIVLSWMA